MGSSALAGRIGYLTIKAWSIGALGNPFWGKSSGHFSGQAPHLGPKLPILDPKLPSLDPKKLISPDSFPESIDHSKMHAFWPNQCAACFNLSRDDISSDASENSDGPEWRFSVCLLVPRFCRRAFSLWLHPCGFGKIVRGKFAKSLNLGGMGRDLEPSH